VWPISVAARGLRRGSAGASLLGLGVQILSGSWMTVSCDCCVLSGRVLCDGLITPTKESSLVWCVWVWWRILDYEEALGH